LWKSAVILSVLCHERSWRSNDVPRSITNSNVRYKTAKMKGPNQLKMQPVDCIKVLHPTQHKIGHFWDILSLSPPADNRAMMFVWRLTEDYRNYSVLCCMWQLCTMIHTHVWAFLTDVLVSLVLGFSFVSLSLDVFCFLASVLADRLSGKGVSEITYFVMSGI